MAWRAKSTPLKRRFDISKDFLAAEEKLSKKAVLACREALSLVGATSTSPRIPEGSENMVNRASLIGIDKTANSNLEAMFWFFSVEELQFCLMNRV